MCLWRKYVEHPGCTGEQYSGSETTSPAFNRVGVVQVPPGNHYGGLVKWLSLRLSILSQGYSLSTAKIGAIAQYGRALALQTGGRERVQISLAPLKIIICRDNRIGIDTCLRSKVLRAGRFALLHCSPMRPRFDSLSLHHIYSGK